MKEAKSSYRYSHASADYGKKYQMHYSGDNYNTRVWELEKEALLDILKRYFGLGKVPRYLDFACGTGRVCSFLENKTERSVGVDVSDSMLEVARKNCKSMTFIKTDITKENGLVGEKFDLITAFRFFLNAEMELRKSALKQIRGLLNKDGILVFNIHGNKNSLRHIPLSLAKIIYGKEGRNEMSPNETIRLLEECGFSVREVIGVSFLLEIFKFLPRSLWLVIEKKLQRISFLKEKAIDFIVIVQINEKT